MDMEGEFLCFFSQFQYIYLVFPFSTLPKDLRHTCFHFGANIGKSTKHTAELSIVIQSDYNTTHAVCKQFYLWDCTLANLIGSSTERLTCTSFSPIKKQTSLCKALEHLESSGTKCLWINFYASYAWGKTDSYIVKTFAQDSRHTCYLFGAHNIRLKTINWAVKKLPCVFLQGCELSSGFVATFLKQLSRQLFDWTFLNMKTTTNKMSLSIWNH